MSDSEKGNKGAGYEYWSRRNYKRLESPSSENKKITRRVERHKRKQADKDITKNIPKNNEDKGLDK